MNVNSDLVSEAEIMEQPVMIFTHFSILIDLAAMNLNRVL